MEQNRLEVLLKEYGEVSNNFRLLTDIRFKLLAFLPIATAVAAALKDEDLGAHLVLSLFGFAVTIGLAIYNTRNDQLYDALIGRATEIERDLLLPEGAFANRPRPWLAIRLLGMTVKIDHRTGVGTIYAASITLWLFGIYLPAVQLGRHVYLSSTDVPASSATDAVTWIYFLALALAVLCTHLALKSIQRQKKTRHRRMRELAANAVSQMNSLGIEAAAEDKGFVGTCAELAGIDPATVRARASFYGSLEQASLRHYMPTEPKVRAMSHFIALLTDLPPRWIFDCATNRRNAVNASTVRQPTAPSVHPSTP